MSHVHDVFYESMLKKYTRNPSHILPYAEIPLQPYVTYEEQPVEILAIVIVYSTTKRLR